MDEKKYSIYKNRYCAETKAKWMTTKYFEKIIKKRSNWDILIIGVDKGHDLLLLRDVFQKYPGTKFNITLLDIKLDPVVKKAKKFLKSPNVKIDFIETNIIYHQKKLDKKYSICICNEVLEHLWDVEKELALININKYLKKSGVLLIAVPQQHFLKRLFYSKFMSGSIQKQQKRVHLDYRAPERHKGVPSYISMQSLLIRKGFDPKIRTTSPLPNTVAVSKKNYPVRFISDFLATISLSMSAEFFIVAVKEKELPKQWYNDYNYYKKWAEDFKNIN